MDDETESNGCEFAKMMSSEEIMPTFYEFFAGGGMARKGLGAKWQCKFANEIDPKKSATYIANWGDTELLTRDVAAVVPQDLRGTADLAWASFPCQDLSLAGVGAGLVGGRSGMFWPFWRLILSLRDIERAPNLVVLENVCGALTSNGGKDFSVICDALWRGGYKFGAVVLDAAKFLPQSRPRLFIIGVKKEIEIPSELTSSVPSDLWHTCSLREAYSNLNSEVTEGWQWWAMPSPKVIRPSLASIIESNPTDVRWHSPAETERILAMMSELNLAKVNQAKKAKALKVGAIYRRTRPNNKGKKIQRAEVRFDDMSGCLRTPAGGSSRQMIMIVEGKKIRTRLISARETARLMGLDDSYVLPKSYNEAYHLTGDGLAVPVVRFLASTLLEPLLVAARRRRTASVVKDRAEFVPA